MTLQRRLLIGIILLTLFSLAACNRSDEGPTTTPTKTSTPEGEPAQAATDTPVPPHCDCNQRTGDAHTGAAGNGYTDS